MQESMHMLLYRAFHAQRNILRPYMRALGLGAGQPKLIAYLAEHGPCRQSELADYFSIDPAAISRMVESLEKGGFITVEADKSNRRRKIALRNRPRSGSGTRVDGQARAGGGDHAARLQP